MLDARPILEIEGLRKFYQIRRNLGAPKAAVQALNDVSFSIRRGEVLGLVGESGSGKSTIGQVVLRLQEATAGRIVFDGVDLRALPKRQLRAMRRRMQMIFQDPYSSLNPFMRVGEALEEALIIHKIGATREIRRARIAQLLEMVRLPASFATRFPHELSGGQRQRVSIARALAVEPDFIVADEAVSALDVSSQAQVINVLMDLKRRLNLTILFISHNMAVVQNIADRVAVVYLGRLMEIGTAEQLFRNPQHPYTKALLSSIPVPDPDAGRQKTVLTGDIPSPINPPSGCVFRTRCPVAMESCAHTVPPPVVVGENHLSHCLRN